MDKPCHYIGHVLILLPVISSNDEQQNDALDIGHHMLTLMLDNKLYLAPLDDARIRNVLDLGCGTGIWTMDFADAHQNAEVTGIDLSPTQPPWVPPNCRFEIDDIEDEWTFPKDHFDFIHIRCLMGSISEWPKLYAQAYKHMAPGGWIQHLDMDIGFTSDDGTVGKDHTMTEWSQTFFDAGEKMGKTFYVVDSMSDSIRKAGFKDIHQAWYKIPVGGWTKDKVCESPGSTIRIFYLLPS
jgi:SAM-dependent methyltransferase